MIEFTSGGPLSESSTTASVTQYHHLRRLLATSRAVQVATGHGAEGEYVDALWAHVQRTEGDGREIDAVAKQLRSARSRFLARAPREGGRTADFLHRMASSTIPSMLRKLGEFGRS
jgi:hypothetical protein